MKLLVLLICALILSGCAMNFVKGEWVDLPDGRQVMCVGTSDSGVSCDWAGARKKP